MGENEPILNSFKESGCNESVSWSSKRKQSENNGNEKMFVKLLLEIRLD